jgi:hypothetical protein
MAVTYDAWGNAQGQEQEGPGVWKERWVQGGPEGGTLEKYWESDAQAAAGESTAYDFGRYSTDVAKLPTLAAGDITRDPTTGAWSYNQGNEYLNKAMHNADKGANYYGIAALLKGNQDYSAATGEGSYADTSRLSDATYKQLASFMGIDPNDPAMRSKVLEGANNYAMVKGMTGLNPNDLRASTQTLYKKQDDGSWAPQLNYDWSEREKGSWFEEGGYGILAPLGVVGAGLIAGAAAGAAAGSGGGAAGTAAGAGAGEAALGGSTLASGAGGYGANIGAGYLGTAGTGSLGAGIGTAGAAGGGSTLAGSLGAYGGAGLYGSGGITSIMGANYGGSGSLSDTLNNANRARNALNQLSGDQRQQGGAGGLGGGAGSLGGGGGGSDALSAAGGLGGGLGHAAAQEKRWLETAYAPIAAAERRKGLAKGIAEDKLWS